MPNGKIGIAVIGGGLRGHDVTAQLLGDSRGNVRVVSLFEPDRGLARRVAESWGQEGVKICGSHQEAIDCAGVDWVMVFSPNAFHGEQIVYALERGRHVFAEKPLAVSIRQCEEILEAYRGSGRLFATGFVLRYAPIFQKAKALLDSGRLGKIISINANENIAPGHGGYIMCNWRRHARLSGSHILEKCCHDLDLLNWFGGSLPRRVASFGGRDFFVPENEGLRQKYGAETFRKFPDPHAVDSPFLSEKDLRDNQVAILEYRNHMRATFQATMSNAIPERRIYFSCTEGTMVSELYSGRLEYRCLGDAETTRLEFGSEGHGGGDERIMKELYDTMVNGTAPRCGIGEGLESTVVALVLDEAAETGRTIDLEPIWKRLGH